MAEVEDLVTRSARQFTWYPMFQCALALLHCDTGQETKVRADFEGLATRDFADLSRDNEWLYSLSLLCEVAYFLGDDKRAILLYEMLLPYADRNAFGAFEGCVGSVSRYLGLLAAVIGRTGDAIRHFEEGIERNQRMGARPWVTHAQHDLAVALIQRGDAGDRGRASALLTQAANSCGELGMLALGTKIDHALESLGSGTTALAPTIQEGTFRLEGEYWTVAYRGTVSRLRDSKGMRVLAQLLEDPGRPHPSLDLERLRSPGDDSTARAVASGDAGELLDEVARRAYRARLAELRAAVEEADALRRADDVGAMREEMDFLTRELSRALGLGGRSRVAGSTAERARLNVTRAVKSALRRVEGANLDLAAHLGATVRTGTVCVYTPDPRAPITWRVSLGSVHKD